jgi:hypothetical protein
VVEGEDGGGDSTKYNYPQAVFPALFGPTITP